MKIDSLKKARNCIGRKVKWYINSPKMTVVRKGTIEEVFNRNICISGEHKPLRDYPGLMLDE